MTLRWRLVEGTLLFDIRRDLSQSVHVASERPETVTSLRAEHERWYRSPRSGMEPTRIVVGHDAENAADLTSQEWQAPGTRTVWSRNHLVQRKLGNWPWLIGVHRSGTYRFALSRWLRYLRRSIDSTRTRIEIGGVDVEGEILDPVGTTDVLLEAELRAGPAELRTWLTAPDGRTHGAYFVTVERLD